MKASLLGAGLFAKGHDSFEALRAHGTVASPPPPSSATAKAPRPALVPARELRRLPDLARLGIEVATQACHMAGVEPDAVLPVFTSSIGDSAITDYMCRTLAGEQKLLSPLRFQNSVHNAPAGSLSIITGNRHPASFVSAFDDSFALALLEALVLCGSQPAPVLLVCTDVPVPAPLSDVHGEGEMGACALLLAAPRGPAVPMTPSVATPMATLEASVQSSGQSSGRAGGVHRQTGALPEPSSREPSALQRPASVQAWPLLDAVASAVDRVLRLPVGSGSVLHVDLRMIRPARRS